MADTVIGTPVTLQVGFFEVIVIPLVQLWVDMFPGCMSLLVQVGCLAARQPRACLSAACLSINLYFGHACFLYVVGLG